MYIFDFKLFLLPRLIVIFFDGLVEDGMVGGKGLVGESRMVAVGLGLGSGGLTVELILDSVLGSSALVVKGASFEVGIKKDV